MAQACTCRGSCKGSEGLGPNWYCVLEATTVTRSGYGVCAGFGFNCVNLFGKWRRQHTAYADDASNWNCFCEDCQIDEDAHWREMWAQYRGQF